MQKDNNSDHLQNELNRRDFISATTKTLGAALLLSSPLNNFGLNITRENEVTVGEVIDMFISEVPNAPFSETVDTLKAGNRDIKVTGIVTSMFATMEVIQKAIASGANFIIAHEPVFYNHKDETQWLKNDDVYRHKADLLKQHNIAVWRNHDYIHTHMPDGVMTGVVAKLGWEKFYNRETWLALIPPVSLKKVIEHAKEKLGIPTVRYIGNPEQTCSKILLMPGAAGGRRQITTLGNIKPDVLLCGEIQEWETAEYIRDARSQGKQVSLILLGHIASEEPGSVYMADWLKKKLPGIKVMHILSGDSLSFM